MAKGASPRLAIAALAVATAGCVDIAGGAVEVPWAIFAFDGRAITDCACAVPTIASVRLELTSHPDGALRPCDGLSSCTFSCREKIGATPFVIPPGRYLMGLVPLTEGGLEISAAEIERTSPLLRDVVRGQPTELEAFFFKAPCSAGCRGSSATEPCTR
jgi:hypothetical protein